MSLLINQKIRINTYKNAIFQIISIGIGFYIYPLLIGYIDDKSLGVWFTLMTFAGWFMLFDVGISNGLRNKLSELIVKNKIKLSRAYLSSTYFYFAFFLSIIILLIVTIILLIDMSLLFNIKKGSIENLNLSVFLVFFTIVINLFFTINYSLSNSLQNNSFSNYRNVLFNILFISTLLLFSFTSERSLFYISMIFFVCNLLANLYTTFVLYKNNKIFIPSSKLVSFKLFKDNLKLGINFFIINISSVIMFSSDNILISHLIGVEYVVQYTLTMKFFMIFLLLLWFYTGPLWSAYSEKYHKKDFKWIKMTFAKSIIISVILCVCLICSIYFFKNILEFWVNSSEYYDEKLVIAIAFIIMLRIWNGNFSTLLNGLSFTVIQKNTAIFSTVLNIPLSIFLVKYMDLGLNGIAYGSAISLGIFAVIAPFYTYKIIKRESSK